MSKRSSYGNCQLCGERKGKAAMLTHVKKCLLSRKPATGKAVDDVLLLRAEQSGDPLFWLHIAAKPAARLKDLDWFLRDTWLECCGHLSAFYGNARREVGMSTRIGNAFTFARDRLDYVYDFGSSTELVIRMTGASAAALRGAVALLARNEPPIWPCDVCGQPATSLCSECQYEGRGFCCHEHSASHDCGEEMLLPVVNSPRVGMCAYSG